jgi:nucleoside-diphosphate-sugar epimerase
LGRVVAEEAHRGGWQVLPVIRSEESAAALKPEFPEALAADAISPEFWERQAPACEGMVWSMAPSRARPEDDFLAMHQQGAVRAAQWARRRQIPFVYISSTSVYAEDGGSWVDEEAPVATEDARSLAMVEAEQACRKAGGTVLRCAGLYGRARVLKNDGEGPERWLNLTHVEDAARAVAIALRNPGFIFNVCEDKPRCRGKAGGQWPEGMRRARRNKRVSNARLRALGWRPMAVIPDENFKLA